MNVEMKLNQLFANQGFLKVNKDLTSLDEIFDVVVKEIPEITKVELDNYLTSLSEAMEKNSDDELDEAVLENVSGGAILETLATAAGIITFAYGAGFAIGSAIKKWRNR